MADPLLMILSYQDPFDFAVSLFEHAQEKTDRSGFESLSESERAAFCIYPLDAEVKNGGFSQYFYNPSGDFAAETATALQEIGAATAVSLLERAMSVFPGSQPSKEWEERQAQMDELPVTAELLLRAQDDAYYEMMEMPEDPLVLLREYVLARRNLFKEV